MPFHIQNEAGNKKRRSNAIPLQTDGPPQLRPHLRLEYKREIQIVLLKSSAAASTQKVFHPVIWDLRPWNKSLQATPTYVFKTYLLSTHTMYLTVHMETVFHIISS